jgi:hypothetical protein
MYRKKVLLEKSFKFRLYAVVFKGIFFFSQVQTICLKHEIIGIFFFS